MPGSSLEYETVPYRALLEVSEAISVHRELPALFRKLAQRLPAVAPFDFICLVLHDPTKQVMKEHVLETAVTHHRATPLEGMELPIEESASGWVWTHQRPLFVPSLAEDTRFPMGMVALRDIGMQSAILFPLTTAMRRLGTIGFGSLTNQAFSDTDSDLLAHVANLVAVAVDNVLHYQDLSHERDRLRLLLEVTEAIASHRDLEELFRDLAQRLPQVVPFDFINLILHEPTRDVMRLWLLVTSIPSTISPGIETPVDESPGGLVWQTQQPLTVNDITQEHRFPKLMAMFRETGVQSFCVVPLTTAQRRLGAMGFGSLRKTVYQQAEIIFMQQVANQVAVAVDNTLHATSAHSAQQQLAHERDRQRLLLEVNNAVVSHLELRELFASITVSIRRVIKADVVSLALLDRDTTQLKLYALDFPSGKGFIEEGTTCTLCGCPSSAAIAQRAAVVLGQQDLEQAKSLVSQRFLAEGIRSACCVPLVVHDRTFGALNIGSLEDNAFSAADVEMLSEVAKQIALAVANSTAYQEIAMLKDKLTKEKVYLEEEIQTEYNFEEIVGESHALKQILKQVETVAATDSTVLILGDTGTGKELIARALHNRSDRRDHTFVKLNCAAIPTGLLESELFGHEKGAFTGAIASKVGRFELADRGTIFLDEVGEIPLELQVKLLRVLQEQEFERLGSTRTIRVNARVIAATNRDLAQMVAEHTFRSDLYYRLKVFPITVPSLRERPEDIPLLVRHFTQQFAQRMKKRIETIPSEAMTALQNYSWPGNVRELENFVERAVILTHGPDLYVSLTELKQMPRPVSDSKATTLEQAEREHILRTLSATNWVIGGPAGAATKLGMKRTTLHSKMQKMGITRPR